MNAKRKPARAKPKRKSAPGAEKGKLKIGDQWNAITIIALSQSNPLKAVAEFVENSIDARATKVTIFRGKEGGHHYLRIVDNGAGIPRDEAGTPDFRYVATHVCDSIKKRIKAEGIKGIQGEFGIGLLSFWTVGHELTMRSAGADGKIHQMTMKKGNPGYTINHSRALFSETGTELIIKPLLAGLRQLSGDKLQWYLASELRNRILQSGVEIRIIDRSARTEHVVEPRKFSGRKLVFPENAAFSKTAMQLEIYLDEPKNENRIGLYRVGTRVLESMTELDEFNQEPWNLGYLQGLIDAPDLNLSPGSRLGVIKDDSFEAFCIAVKEITPFLINEIETQRRAEHEKASENTLISIQRAFKDAFLSLPSEEYDWFDVHSSEKGGKEKAGRAKPTETASDLTAPSELDNHAPNVPTSEEPIQKAFFEFSGPLYSVRISPASSVLQVSKEKSFRAVCMDRKAKPATGGVTFSWEILEGSGILDSTDSELCRFSAAAEPGLVRIGVTATQGEVVCKSEATITVTDTLIERSPSEGRSKGLPGYTFHKAPGELWRSRFDESKELVVVNNGHRDFVFASQNKPLKLRYLCRLFAKELVKINFPGSSAEELMERLIEISLYVEEKLR